MHAVPALPSSLPEVCDPIPIRQRGDEETWTIPESVCEGIKLQPGR